MVETTTVPQTTSKDLTKEELVTEYHRIRKAANCGIVAPYHIINPDFRGSGTLLKQFIKVFGAWNTVTQEMHGQRFHWKCGYLDAGAMLVWCANELKHSPSFEERKIYQKMNILPSDDMIVSKFGRGRNFAAIYKCIGLPEPGGAYSR
jgi:hypothetical protein